MQFRLWLVLVCVSLSLGCKLFKGGEDKQEAVKDPTSVPWRTGPVPSSPANGQSVAVGRGKVALVDKKLQFVVIDFTYSRMPKDNLLFGVYRNGLKIGEVTTTAQTDDAFLVADINRGDIQMGDDVRP